MRVGFVADVHVANHGPWGGPVVAGVNARAEQVLGVLAAAAVGAQEEGCTALVVLGDLFDDVVPEPQLVTRVQEALGGFHGRLLLMPGNHDYVSDAAGDHALGPLRPIGEVIDTPRLMDLGDAALALVPYRAGPAQRWLMEAVRGLCAAPRGKPTLLGCHVGIVGTDTPPYLRDAADAVTVELAQRMALEFQLAAVVAGHWHKRRFYGRGTIMQVGALAPPSARDAGLEGYGTLGIWDTREGLSFCELPGPRFLTAVGPDGIREAAKEAAATECRVYVRAVAGLDELTAAREAAAEFVQAGGLAGCAVGADEGEVRASARTAAQGARSAKTLQEALGRWVGAMALPDDVDRAAVLARARAYLDRGETT